MKRVSALILAVLTVFLCGACRIVSTKSRSKEQASANITAGAAKVASSGDYIYLVREKGIAKFDPKSTGADAPLDDFIFVEGTYSDVCVFNKKLYAIKMTSDEQTDLVSIDLQSGEEKVIRTYRDDDAGNVWINNMIDNTLYLWVNGSVFTLDKNDLIRDTGYRHPQFITSDGVYNSASSREDGEYGLTFIPDDKTRKDVVEYSELKDSKVNVLFRYGSRIYLTVDYKPAYLEHNGGTKITYVNDVSSAIDSNTVCAYMNYVDSPDKTLIFSVGIFDASDQESPSYSLVYKMDVKTGEITKLYRKNHYVAPLGWISVIGDNVFIGGLLDSMDWIMEE